VNAKKFYEISKAPIVIGAIAAILFCIDSVLAKYIWSLYDDALGRGFMWVAFVGWTISFGMKNNERIRMWLGHIIGFLAAVGIIYFGQLFSASAIGIGIAAVIGVFLFNCLIMYFDNLKKFWLNSIAGIFMGIFLTFSGLGVGLGADTWANAGMTLGIILFYSLLGCVCAFFSVFFIGKWKVKSN
jgi:hypothetical protein